MTHFKQFVMYISGWLVLCIREKLVEISKWWHLELSTIPMYIGFIHTFDPILNYDISNKNIDSNNMHQDLHFGHQINKLWALKFTFNIPSLFIFSSLILQWNQRPKRPSIIYCLIGWGGGRFLFLAFKILIP